MENSHDIWIQRKGIENCLLKMVHTGESETFLVFDVFAGRKEAIFRAFEEIWEVGNWW